jgi:hypothetical protein
LFRSELGIEVARIGRRTDRGEEGRRDPFVENVVPIRVFEEQVRLDLDGVGFGSSETTRRVLCEKLRHERLSVGKRVGRKKGKERLRLTFCKIETESFGMWIGYSGSSSRIASKISSSSSPRKGD